MSFYTSTHGNALPQQNNHSQESTNRRCVLSLRRSSAFSEPPPAPPMNPILCRFLGGFTVIVALFTMTILIAWTILRPQLPSFRVDSATDPYLTATWNLTLIITNPNRRLDITYDAVSANVMYGQDDVLAHTLLSPFIQKKRAHTALQIKCAVVDEFVDSHVAMGLVSDRAHGSLQFGLTFSALIRFRSTTFQSSGYILNAECKPIRFAFSPQNETGGLMHNFLCI